jgi:hypothetical protein
MQRRKTQEKSDSSQKERAMEKRTSLRPPPAGSE